jgi:hypothetical protein
MTELPTSQDGKQLQAETATQSTCQGSTEVPDSVLPQTRPYRRSNGFAASALLFTGKERISNKPPKGKNENRQLEYLAHLSLQRRMEVRGTLCHSQRCHARSLFTHQNHALQQQAAEQELERVTRLRQKARHAVARLSQKAAGAVDESGTSPQTSMQASYKHVNRSSSTSRLPDRVTLHSGETGQLPKYRHSTGATRGLSRAASDGENSKSTSPEKHRFSQSPTAEPPKGYRSHTERLQSFMRDQQRKQPIELISCGAVTKEDKKQRSGSHHLPHHRM